MESFWRCTSCLSGFHLKSWQMSGLARWRTLWMLSQTEGNLFTRKALLCELQVRFNFIKVMQNSSRLTKVSRFGNLELVTPTLLIWSSQAAKHSSWPLPTCWRKATEFATNALLSVLNSLSQICKLNVLKLWYLGSKMRFYPVELPDES